MNADELIKAAPRATALVNEIAGADAAREVAVAGGHKARLELGIGYFTTVELAESRQYLEARGMLAGRRVPR